MPPRKEQEGVRYEEVDSGYLEDRKLAKSAGWVLLWALGVGAVISGDFSGWQYGLPVGGFLGLTIATLVVAALYVCLVFSIAELSAALPHAGGFYSFVRNALGPTWGYVCGVTDTIEYVVTPAAVAYFTGGYLAGLIPGLSPKVCWLALYLIFVLVNIRGAALTLKVGLLITAVAVSVLLTFFCAALWTGAFSWERLWNIAAPGQSGGNPLPFGWFGVFTALPFATWFFLAIEQLPLAAEETHDVVRDMPRALILGIITLLALALATLVINSGVGGGAEAIGKSAAPLEEGFRAALGDGAAARVLTLLAVAGLVASFHTILYAAGRVLFALSRAGYFPRSLSVTSRWHTPGRALWVATGVGLGCVAVLEWAGGGVVGSALLNISVAGAVVSYTLVLVAFIRLRLARPDLPRPYRSPLGVPGAVVGMLLSILVLCACFAVRDYRFALYGVCGFVGLALIYFAAYSRRRLVANAPEEEAALHLEALRELEQPSNSQESIPRDR